MSELKREEERPREEGGGVSGALFVLDGWLLRGFKISRVDIVLLRDWTDSAGEITCCDERKRELCGLFGLSPEDMPLLRFGDPGGDTYE